MRLQESGKKGPCPECNSSDANHHYPDGHTYCFSCNTFKPVKSSDGDALLACAVEGNLLAIKELVNEIMSQDKRIKELENKGSK